MARALTLTWFPVLTALLAVVAFAVSLHRHNASAAVWAAGTFLWSLEAAYWRVATDRARDSASDRRSQAEHAASIRSQGE